MPQTRTLIRKLSLVSLLLAVGIFIGYSMPSIKSHNTDSSEKETTQSNTLARKESRSTLDEAQVGTNALPPVALQVLSFDQKVERFKNLQDVNTHQATVEKLSLLSTMSEAELQQLLEDASPKRISRHELFNVFRALVDKNLKSAINFYRNKSNPELKSVIVHYLFDAWYSLDADGALVAARAIEKKSERTGAIDAIARSVAGKDPESAFNIIMAQDEVHEYQLSMVIRMWSRQDANAAMAMIETMEIGENRRHAISSFIGGIANENPNKAAEMAMSLTNLEERKVSMKNVMSTWINQDIDGAIHFLESMEDGKNKNDLFKILGPVRLLTRKDPAKALEFANKYMTGKAKDDATSYVLRTMADNDPEKVAAMLAGLPYGRVYERSVGNLARSWSEKDPKAALEWASRMEDSKEKKNALKYIFDNLVKNNTSEAKAYLLQLEDKNQRQQLASSISKKLAKKDPIAAIAWSQTINDQATSENAYHNAIDSWINQDPVAVIDYLTDKNDVDYIRRCASRIASKWAQKDLESAAEWAERLEDDEAQKKAFNAISKEWIEHDNLSASTWISEMEAGVGRDKAVTNLVFEVLDSDPDAAFLWAATIGNEFTRKYYTEKTITRLMLADPQQALELISSSDLAESEKAQLLKIVTVKNTAIP